MAVNKTKEQELAVLEFAAKALNIVKSPELTPDEVRAIQKIDATSHRALRKTEFAGFGRKLPCAVTTGSTTNSEKVQNVAHKNRVVKKTIPGNIFALSAKKAAKVASKSNDVQTTVDVVSDAIQIAEAQKNRVKDLSVEELTQALNTPSEIMVEEAVKTAAQNQKAPPHVAKEILYLCLGEEKRNLKILERHKKELESHEHTIQQFLKLSGLLEALPKEQETYNLQELILDKASGPEKEELEKCIKELFPNGSSVITKEQLAGGKVRINDIKSEHTTAMTNLLTIKIQAEVLHTLQAMLQILQNSMRLDERLSATIQGNSRGGR